MPPTTAPRASSVSEFKQKKEPTLLPSGKYMVLKHTSLAAFLQMGSIPNSLMSMIQSAIDEKGPQVERKVNEAVADLIKDPEGLKDLFTAVDSFMCAVALEPRVYPTPENEDDRRDDLLYVDEVELDDKMFVFQRAVGGPAEAAPFHQEPAPGVGSVRPRKAVGSTAKRSAGARKSSGG